MVSGKVVLLFLPALLSLPIKMYIYHSIENNMVTLFKSSLGRFRLIGLVEAVSYILLTGIAMPMKYLAGMPEAVKMAGMAHGVLFVLYMFMLITVALEYGWKLRFVLIIFGASLVPFLTFYVDKAMLSKISLKEA